MIKAKTLVAVERERERERATLYSTWKSSTRLHTNNSIENKQGRNAFINHTKQTDYILRNK